jgi:hypothetical protein
MTATEFSPDTATQESAGILEAVRAIAGSLAAGVADPADHAEGPGPVRRPWRVAA